MTKRQITGYAHPVKPSEHAIDRWRERHRSARTRQAAEAELRALLPSAQLVEVDAANLQAIWKLPIEDGIEPLLVVDAFGLVRTVLPRHATPDKQRGRGYARKM